MVYVFTNVHRFRNDGEFVDALRRTGMSPGSDTLVFLNTCVPYVHARAFFDAFDVVTLNRRRGTTDEWFGYDVAKGIRSRSTRRLRIDDEGRVVDERGDAVCVVETDGYPHGKCPTTGYYAVKLAETLFPDAKIVLVNFYGDDDSSTYKTSEHDWRFENEFLRGERAIDGRCMFIEPANEPQSSRTEHAGPSLSELTRWEDGFNPYFYGGRK